MKKMWLILLVVIVTFLVFMSYYILLFIVPEKKEQFTVGFYRGSIYSRYEGYTNDSEYTEIIFTINESNIGAAINESNIEQIEFGLYWYDDYTDDNTFRPPPFSPNDGYDTIQMNITGPNDTYYSDDSNKEESIYVEFFIQEKPYMQSIFADSKKEAIDSFINYKGTGNWTITISVDASGGDFISGPDEGNDWTLQITGDYYIPYILED